MSFALPTAARLPLRNLLPSLSSPFRSSLVPSTSALPTRTPLSFAPFAFTTLPLPTAFQLASLASLFPDSLEALRELLPPWVLAVPKSKTSHSKKSMRSSGKGLKEQQGAFVCQEEWEEELMRFPGCAQLSSRARLVGLRKGLTIFATNVMSTLGASTTRRRSLRLQRGRRKRRCRELGGLMERWCCWMLVGESGWDPSVMGRDTEQCLCRREGPRGRDQG